MRLTSPGWRMALLILALVAFAAFRLGLWSIQRSLTPDELQRITGKGSLVRDRLTLSLYNSSGLDVKQISVELVVHSLSGQTLRRVYEMAGNLDNHHAAEFSANLAPVDLALPFNLLTETRRRWPALATWSDYQIYYNLSNPSRFRGAFSDYSWLTEDQIKRIVTSESTGGTDVNGAWSWKIVEAKGVKSSRPRA